MSVNLFKCIAKTLRHSVVLPLLSKVPTRHYVTLMDTATENTKDTSADMSTEKEEVLRNKNSTRYKRRWFERKWEDPKPRNTENGESEEKKIKSEDRIKRKKMAMLLGYCGANYYGMQRNPGVQTIEEELLKALWEAKYITEDDFNNQQNAQFQRSSRTDKGVSAARQVVSLKLPLETDIEEINKRLPDCIRVFAVKRVTNKFNSKVKCNARTYSYTLPTYAFAPEVASDEDRTSYRIPEHTLDKIKEVLAFYKGTKCYHNFTEKKYFNDPSASRYMMSFTVDRVFEHSGMQFAVLLVKGQSFMLHQIRKMVGLAIAVVRGHTGMDTMERVFGREKVMLPTAPGLGLVLDMVHYDRYADKHKESHDSLTWEGTEEAVQRFKEEHIYPYIVRGEIDDGSMHLWLTEKLSNHNYEPSEDSNNDKETTNAEKETENDEKETENDEKATENDEKETENNEKETSAEKETKCLDSESVGDGDGADKCKNTDASNSSDSK